MVGSLRIFAALLFIFPLAAEAQELSTEEMLTRFGEHTSDLGKTRSLSSKPQEKHRGLVLAPSSNDTNPTTEEIDFVAVDPDKQVNVRIVFDLNSSLLREDQKPRLTPVCGAMRSLDTTLFQIVGHTDASGAEAYNDRLSVFRAEAVRTHLVEVCGIVKERLQAIGVGERYLFDPVLPQAEANRRVEFQAVGEVGG